MLSGYRRPFSDIFLFTIFTSFFYRIVAFFPLETFCNPRKILEELSLVCVTLHLNFLYKDLCYTLVVSSVHCIFLYVISHVYLEINMLAINKKQFFSQIKKEFNSKRIKRILITSVLITKQWNFI